MKLMLLVLLVILVPFGEEDHDSPIANYQFVVHREVITLESQFDKEDLTTAIQKTNKEAVNKASLIKYFNYNTSFYINQAEVELVICGYRTDAEHYYLDIELPVDVDRLKELKVFSTCLVKEIENHNNLLFVEEEGKEMRGYRLHKNRIHTTIEF